MNYSGGKNTINWELEMESGIYC